MCFMKPFGNCLCKSQTKTVRSKLPSFLERSLLHRHFRFCFARRCSNRERAGGLERPTLVLIVQPRKRRKVPPTSVWNGRNCLCHGSAKIRLRRSHTCTLPGPRPVSLRGHQSLSEEGFQPCFVSVNRPSCVSGGRRTIGDCGSTLLKLSGEGWARRLVIFHRWSVSVVLLSTVCEVGGWWQVPNLGPSKCVCYSRHYSR